MRPRLPRATLLQVYSLVTLLGMLLLGLSLVQLVGGGIEIVAEARARDELSDQIRTRKPFWLDLPAQAWWHVHVSSDAEVAKWQAQGVQAVADGKDWENKVQTI